MIGFIATSYDKLTYLSSLFVYSYFVSDWRVIDDIRLKLGNIKQSIFSKMARKLLEMDAGDGTTILVAVEIPEEAVADVDKFGDIAIEKVEQSFEAVKDLIVRGCRPLTEAFETLYKEGKATSAEAEFGVNFTGKGNIYLMEASGGASLKIKVTWNLATDK